MDQKVNQLVEYYTVFKSLHIIGFVSWFAGLFYLVRMFVYYSEYDAQPKEFQEAWKQQFNLMSRRVYKIISTPAMVITWFFGVCMLSVNQALLSQTWIKVKLVLLVLLTIYHFYCKSIVSKQAEGQSTFNSFQFRLLNELPTLFLVSIVFLAVLRDMQSFVKLFGGVLLFGVLLFLGVKAYKKSREK